MLVIGLMSSTLIGCSNTSSDAGKSLDKENARKANNELIAAVTSEPETGFDATDTGHGDMTSVFFSTLFKRNKNLGMENDLAKSYEISEDRLTWTVKIREDVKFTDGENLTAEDVVYTYEIAKNSGSSIDLTMLDSVSKVDDYTVEFKLKNPQSTFIEKLATVGIVPKHAHNEGFSDNPIGSGPYKLVQWDKGQQVIAKENENYIGAENIFNNLIEDDFINSGLAVITIAVSVWVGLNIYNNCKESYLEKQLEELKNKHLEVENEYHKQLFLKEVEQTESMYELSKYFFDAFRNNDQIEKEEYRDFYQIERTFVKCVKAYEKGEKVAVELYSEKLNKIVFQKIENEIFEQWSLGDMYLKLRLSDAMYYHADNNEKELQDSVKIYEEAMNYIKRENNEFVGYMENTIGYTYLKLYRECESKQKKESYRKKAEEYLAHAQGKNHKGRYLQNMGAYFESLNTIDGYEKALEWYNEALNAKNIDKKIYNLLGAVMLKIVEAEMGINVRFKNNILLDSFDRVIDPKVKNYIADAYIWLHVAVNITPWLINTHYNLAKAALYYAIFVVEEKERNNLLKEAELRIKIAEKMESENIGMLFTKRNYYEAIGDLQNAILVNNKIKKKLEG